MSPPPAEVASSLPYRIASQRCGEAEAGDKYGGAFLSRQRDGVFPLNCRIAERGSAVSAAHVIRVAIACHRNDTQVFEVKHDVPVPRYRAHNLETVDRRLSSRLQELMAAHHGVERINRPKSVHRHCKIARPLWSGRSARTATQQNGTSTFSMGMSRHPSASRWRSSRDEGREAAAIGCWHQRGRCRKKVCAVIARHEARKCRHSACYRHDSQSPVLARRPGEQPA